MKKEIGIVICNYNKEDYIVKCIKSILDSTIQNFQIYVVDNASADCSVKRIREQFPTQVVLIENEENLGGSGGFNRGLEEAVKEEYAYYMCVDNDVSMDCKNIEKLYRYMEENKECGMAGSRVMLMDNPDKIQAMGAKLDFTNYTFHDNYRNYIVDEKVPEVVECDYVPACSMMIRKETIDKINLIPQDTFVYWDDMEWGFLCKRSGYRVVSLKDAIVYHKGNFKNKTTFPKYYMWRNRIAFFMKYVKEEQQEDFAEKILSELFQMIYGCGYKKEYHLIDTLIFALDDAIHGVCGKAAEGKIFNRDNVKHKVDIIFENRAEVAIENTDDFEALEEIVGRLKKINPDICVTLLASKEKARRLLEQFQGVSVQETTKDTKCLKICTHVFDVKEYHKGEMYIDKYCNMIVDEADFEYCKNFTIGKFFFTKCHKQLLQKRMKEMHN